MGKGKTMPTEPTVWTWWAPDGYEAGDGVQIHRMRDRYVSVSPVTACGLPVHLWDWRVAVDEEALPDRPRCRRCEGGIVS